VSKQPLPAKRRAEATIWVPPGTVAVASPEVQVREMVSTASADAPGEGASRLAPSLRTDTGKARRVRRRSQSQQGFNWQRFEQDLARLERRWATRVLPPAERVRPDKPKEAKRPDKPQEAKRPYGLWKVKRPYEPQEAEGPDEPELLTVPPEVEAQAQQVMALYDMKVRDMLLITTKPDKGGAIWRIDTNKGPRSLKQLHRPSARSLFSIAAQDYLVAQGARVPALVPTRDGDLSVEVEGKRWIVTDWIDELTQASKVGLEGAQVLCYGLGEFHRHSQGYVPPRGARKATRLFKWPQHYRKIQTKIGWFREIATAYPEMAASAAVLSLCDQFEEQARQAVSRLEASAYGALVARGEPAWGLVHQDYGWSNGQMGPGGVWIIDLDGVAYDLPIRDLRKLITSTMDDMGVWDPTWIKGMIDAYAEANPIEPELYQVLLIDMSLPNEFYKHAKEMVMSPTTFLNAELEALLQRLVQSDATKWEALRALGLTDAGAVQPRAGRPKAAKSEGRKKDGDW
jgi:CotS family spore coat protein